MSGNRALPSYLLPMADKTRVNLSLSGGFPNGWSNGFSYDKYDLSIPEGVKCHQTHKMAVTYADIAGADPQTICDAATWANTWMFAKFYLLDIIANSDAEFGQRVLMLACSSILAPHHWGRYRVPQKHQFHW